MKIGKGSRIGINSIVVRPSKISIGERCVINEYCHLDGRGGLTIGNDVSISIYTIIISATHDMTSRDFKFISSPVLICDNVWIGTKAMILDNAILNENCIIGAGCVFKGVAKQGTVYIGNPSKELKQRKLIEKYKLQYECYFH